VGGTLFPSSSGPLIEVWKLEGSTQYLSCSWSCSLLDRALRCWSWDLLKPLSQSQPQVLRLLLVPLLLSISSSFQLPLSARGIFSRFSCSFFLMLLSHGMISLLLSSVVCQPPVWLLSHHLFINLDLEDLRDLCSVILHYLWRNLPLWLWDFQSILCTVSNGVLSGVVDQVASIAFVLRACSSAALISASVLSFRPAFTSHWQDFLISVNYLNIHRRNH